MNSVYLLWYSSFPDTDLIDVFSSFGAAEQFVKENYLECGSAERWEETDTGRWKDAAFLAYLTIEQKPVKG